MSIYCLLTLLIWYLKMYVSSNRNYLAWYKIQMPVDVSRWWHSKCSEDTAGKYYVYYGKVSSVITKVIHYSIHVHLKKFHGKYTIYSKVNYILTRLMWHKIPLSSFWIHTAFVCLQFWMGFCLCIAFISKVTMWCRSHNTLTTNIYFSDLDCLFIEDS